MVLEPCGYIVIRVQGVLEGTEYAALRGSAQGQYRGGEAANSHNLSVRKSSIQSSIQREVLNPRLLSLRMSLAGSVE